MRSIKENFLYSFILTGANYIFPLIVYPYIMRVLGVGGIGLCDFVDSIINYFILFSMMGMSIVGIREIAACKEDSAKLTRTFNSLLTVNAIATLVALIALVVATFAVAKLREHTDMMAFGMVKLVANLFLFEWFYKGVEDFRFVTIRSIVVRTLFVIAVFAFVHTPEDVGLYYFLTVMIVVVNALVNVKYLRRFVRVSFSFRDAKLFLSPFLLTGCYMLLTSMYTTFNTAYLGFVSSDVEVGYYSVSARLFTVLLSVYTAFTGVMLPRMSSLLAQGENVRFKELIGKSVDILMCFAIPIVIFSELLTPEIIRLISGPGYEGAILPMRIIMPLVFVIGYEQILVNQALMPLKKDRVIMVNSIVGAVLGVSLNLALVGCIYATGSAIVWCSSEVAILILSQIFVTRFVGVKFPIADFLKNILCYLPAIALLYMLSVSGLEFYWKVATGVFGMIVYFVLVQHFVIKNRFVLEAVEGASSKFRKR